MQNLTLAGLNLDIVWKNKEANYQQIEDLLKGESADVFLLPEMFATGFYMNPADTADRSNETLNWMKSFANHKKSVVCGSVAVLDEGNFYNRFYFVEPGGKTRYYDKVHLFSYSGENRKFQAGEKRVIVNYKGWRLLLQVCYDLRFPVFSRNNGDYDAILYVANWPESRIGAWQTLLKARAIENQAYVFGLNRTGTDGNKLYYPESSSCIFADGSEVAETENQIVRATLNAEQLEAYREKFPFLNDADDFQLI